MCSGDGGSEGSDDAEAWRLLGTCVYGDDAAVDEISVDGMNGVQYMSRRREVASRDVAYRGANLTTLYLVGDIQVQKIDQKRRLRCRRAMMRRMRRGVCDNVCLAWLDVGPRIAFCGGNICLQVRGPARNSRLEGFFCRWRGLERAISS